MEKKIKTIKKGSTSKLPKNPGVYLFYGKKREILYVGKATNLKNRVNSHFKIPKHKLFDFTDETKKIGYIPLQSEIEALLTESKLIKTSQPKYNILLRDDKNYFYVGIIKHDWPRIYITHQPLDKEQQKKQKVNIEYIGPFTEGRALKETLKFLRKAFPYRSCHTISKRSCFWYDLERCPAPCILKRESQVRQELGDQTKKREIDYKRNVQKLKQILLGKKTSVLKKLNREMKKFAKNQDFEKAAELRNQINAIQNIFSHRVFFENKNFFKEFEPEKDQKDVGLLLKNNLGLPKIPKRIEGYDVSNMQSNQMVGSMVVFVPQIKNKIIIGYYPDKKEYRLFKIKTVKRQNDIACLKETISRRLNHKEWKIPDLIYIDGGKAQFNAVNQILKNFPDFKIPVISLAKNKNILYNNFLRTSLPLDKLNKVIKMTILRLRDESHRFAISYHKKLRKKSLFETH
jgi:excinuclease ABC subunit C